MIIDKKESICTIIDISLPAGGRMHDKERAKARKDPGLRRETGRMG